jgi:hypothetical protein
LWVINVQYGIWCELVKLYAVNKEKPMKKFVGRKGQAAQKKGKKHHPIDARGLGDAIGAGEDDLVTSGEKSILLGLSQIGLLELRRHPAGRRVGDLLLPHLVLVGKAFDAHLQKLCQGGRKGARKRKGDATMVEAEGQ